MTHPCTWLVLVLGAVMAAAAGCSGCGEHAREEPENLPVRQEPELLTLDIPLEPQSPRLDDRLMRLGGQVDVENRYPSAVMVTAVWSEDEVMRCSGAAISTRVVLTAGHCLCARRQQTRSDGGPLAVIDASACLDSARVETVIYKPPVEEGTQSSGSWGKSYRGRVQPHPALRVTLDGQGRVLASHADLALVILGEPLAFPGVPLSDEEERVGDSILLVGHEYDEVADVFGGERRFSVNKVLRIMTGQDERVLIQQPGGHRYRLDSGGPCLRQAPKGPMLVGISSRWLGEGAAYTSIHRHRAWLREEIRRIEETRVVPQ